MKFTYNKADYKLKININTHLQETKYLVWSETLLFLTISSTVLHKR